MRVEIELPEAEVDALLLLLKGTTVQRLIWALELAKYPLNTRTGWREAAGCAPRADGEMSPEDAVRKVRDE